MGEAVLQAFQDSLLGGSAAQVEPAATSAIEACIRVLSTPYALATVTGPSVITPSFLTDLARQLFTRGNACYQILLGDDGMVELIPAASRGCRGNPLPNQSLCSRALAG